MKVHTAFVTLLSVVMFDVSARAAEPAAEVAALAAGNNAFACELYAQLKGTEGNLFFSPYSVSTALAMTYAGARGETAAQMAKALHFTQGQPELHPAFAALADRMNAVQAAGHVRLSVANSLWPQRGHPFIEDYMGLVKKNYGATIAPLDFQRAEPAARTTINQWVEEKTQKKIVNLIGSPLDPLTRMVLVNAVYFKGNWENQFKASQTQNAPFQRTAGGPVQVPMMMQTHEYRYAELAKLQIIELPYAGNELSMLVVLPASAAPNAAGGGQGGGIGVAKRLVRRLPTETAPPDGLEIEAGVAQPSDRPPAVAATLADVESDLTADTLQQWRQRLVRREVRLFLPKFKITWGTYSLKPALQTLGMRDAFTLNADFSGMDGQRGNLSISDVLHKAFVDVNEEGTEAAAATAVVMRTLAVAAPPPVFRADHPFLFLIQENGTGSILFMGRVANPTESVP